MTHSSALIAFEGSRRLRRYLCKDGWRCIRLGSRPQGRGQFGLESRPNGFGVRLDKPHCRYDVASVTECGANPMKIQSLLIASLLLTGTALAEPVPRVGLCPSNYYSQGNYCVPDERAKPAIVRNENCPTGYFSQGNYCIPWKDNTPIAVPKIGVTCPSGYLSQGNYCVEY